MINDTIVLTCVRRNHSWKRRGKVNPKFCPRCKSPYWDKPRKRISAQYVQELKEFILVTHNEVIKTSGGELGVRDDGGIYFSTYAIASYMAKNYQDVPAIGAFIFSELAKKHHFVDGNKRTAFIMAKVFMMIWGRHIILEYRDALPFVLEISKYNSRVTFKDIKEWIEKNSEPAAGKNIATYLKSVLLELILKEDETEKEN